MKRTISTILALAFSGALLAACDNAGQAPSGAGGTSSTDPDRTKRATPGAPTAPGGAAGSGSTTTPGGAGSSSGSTNK